MKINAKDGRYEYIIEGPIDENTDIFDQAIPGATEVHLELDKMTFINSIGITKWKAWVTGTVPANAKIFLKNCPSILVSQLHLIQAQLFKHAQVLSLKAPFFCDSCEFEKNVLLTWGKDFNYAAPGKPKSVELPADVKCSECNATMEPDFVADRFFRFLD